MNGTRHTPAPPAAAPPPMATAVMLERIEQALADMTHALTLSGFSLDEAGQVTLSTRFSIASLVRDRARRSS